MTTVEARERWHGTIGGYMNHRCRCPDCREANSQYGRAYRLLNPRKPVTAKYITDRLDVAPDGCWLWRGRVDRWGYGKDCAGLPAHRSAYRALVGEIPTGLVLDHLCHVRACCNPAHLEPVTPEENQRRARIRPRSG